MEQVLQSAAVHKGDTIITTGLPGAGNSQLQSFYPAGILIGRVDTVTNNEFGKVIQVTPFVNFETLDAVAVLEAH
jgi:cell shape-determining protein MreC